MLGSQWKTKQSQLILKGFQYKIQGFQYKMKGFQYKMKGFQLNIKGFSLKLKEFQNPASEKVFLTSFQQKLFSPGPGVSLFIGQK